MKKGLVKVSSFELVSRSYARKFSPACNFAYYHLQSSFTEEELKDPEVMGRFFKAGIDRITDENEIKEIEQILSDWKKRHLEQNTQ